jgi:hypothetical protein
VVGHSAGGQTVQRYALVTGSDTPALHTRFVVANPSSFGYLNASRWADTSNPTILHQPDAALCPTYNSWVRLPACPPVRYARVGPLYVPVKDVCGWCGCHEVALRFRRPVHAVRRGSPAIAPGGRAVCAVPPPEHNYHDQNSGLTEIYLRF